MPVLSITPHRRVNDFRYCVMIGISFFALEIIMFFFSRNIFHQCNIFF